MDLIELCEAAKNARADIRNLRTEEKNDCLKTIARCLVEDTDKILMENAKDISAATVRGMHVGMIDRLRLNEERIKAMAEGLEQIALLPDPIGEVLDSFDRPNGLHLKKTRVPLGVIGIIYESRPNVTSDAFGLCFKSGNVVILKGGSDAIFSNIAITDSIARGLRISGINEASIGLITDTDRETTNAFMKMNDYVDVLIPRGGAGLIRNVVNNSTIPVIETGTGNCHIYIDEFANPAMAKEIIVNAKTQRIGVCNACESLVVHESVRKTILPEVARALREKTVEIRGDECAVETIQCVPATEEDYGSEYLDYIISVKTVSSIEQAIAHINKYSTGHSEAIISDNQERITKFLNEIDSACVYANASTRFTDGFEFGFGAEIGISTQMLHARGPMGLKELTTYKYKITGNGQVRK
ncbi:MAG: glutamate-5-semialdehyde dehydrogenase [Lachnospiraceae bacterium]